MSKLFGTAVVLLASAGSALAQVYPGQVEYGQPSYGQPNVYPEQYCPPGQAMGGGGDIPYGEDYGGGPQGLGYPGVISNGGGDELYPYDQQDPWLHGYFQEIPAYGGYAHFRPYNYRHVLAQTQAAAGWGLSKTMPYSHQYWQQYHERASLQHCPLPYRAYDQYENQPAAYRAPANQPRASRTAAPRR